jgi:hypothetical protein
MDTIEQLQKTRFQFLHTLYLLTNGATSKDIYERTIGQALGLDDDTMQTIADYLHDAGLLKNDRGHASMQHKGIVTVESMLSSPSTPSSEVFPLYSTFTDEEKSLPQKAVESIRRIAENMEIQFDKTEYRKGDTVYVEVNPGNHSFTLLTFKEDKQLPGRINGRSHEAPWTGELISNVEAGHYSMVAFYGGQQGKKVTFDVK